MRTPIGTKDCQTCVAAGPTTFGSSLHSGHVRLAAACMRLEQQRVAFARFEVTKQAVFQEQFSHTMAVRSDLSGIGNCALDEGFRIGK